VSSPKYLKTFYRYLLLSMILLALIGAAFAFLPKIEQFHKYQNTKSELEAKIRAENKRCNELRLNQQKFTTDKHFVQRLAHEKGFAHEGETIYQFEEPMTNIETRNTLILKE
jgi:predicted  nucleic acid-binding Zn-ribbon protein